MALAGIIFESLISQKTKILRVTLKLSKQFFNKCFVICDVLWQVFHHQYVVGLSLRFRFCFLLVISQNISFKSKVENSSEKLVSHRPHRSEIQNIWCVDLVVKL